MDVVKNVGFRRIELVQVSAHWLTYQFVVLLFFCWFVGVVLFFSWFCDCCVFVIINPSACMRERVAVVCLSFILSLCQQRISKMADFMP